MSGPLASREAAYFEALYAANPDPWDFASSAYEDRKYQASLAALQGRRFNSAFEIGCSIGVLTRKLAARCDALLAIDIVPAALAAAKARCEDLPHVSFANLRVPAEWPAAEQRFDLIICSEILYFLSPADIAAVAARAQASLAPGGVVLLVNYTEPVDEPCGGAEAAEIFIKEAARELAPVLQARQETFRIDLLARPD